MTLAFQQVVSSLNKTKQLTDILSSLVLTAASPGGSVGGGLDRGVKGCGRKRREGGTGGSTVLGPHGRDSSKTCLRWPRRGLNQTGPLVGGAWRRRQAAADPSPHWWFSPLAFLWVKKRGKYI